MSGRRYRVVRRLPWIEGGSPTPEGRWEGGEAVMYQPGATVYVEDQELAGIYHNLEATDDAGRTLLEEARAKIEASAESTFLADLDSSAHERWTRALDEKRHDYGPHRILRDCTVLRDGSKEFSIQYVPVNPLPGVIYGDNGLPNWRATASQRERLEKEGTLARIRNGASLGGRRGRETKRDKTARSNEALLADVRAYCAKHPSHGGPAIAEALVDKHGSIRDHADPRGREKAIEALRKRIERLEKALDR